MRRRTGGLLGILLAGGTLLASCGWTSPNGPSSPVATLPRPAEPAIVAPNSGASAQVADYYARVQTGLLSQGLLRTDNGETDAPFTRRDLVRNFLKIALYEEYVDAGGTLVARESRSRLHRWAMPVTLSVTFGASVPTEMRARDGAEISRYVGQLQRATGHPIRQVSPGSGNFRVYIVGEDERLSLGPVLRSIVPNISTTALNTVVNLPRSTYCLAFATDPEGDGTYGNAIAVIRAEHPDLLRRSCIHEELAQGMGLSNDYALARPSIFNDDEEFGLLTRHDELLLRMLYDRRLRPGMTEAEARPIVEVIAAELMAQGA